MCWVLNRVETKSEENLASYKSYPALELEPTPVQETLRSGTVSFGWPETSGKKKPKPTQRQMKEESIAISEQEIFDPICGTPVTDLSYSSEDEDSLPDSLPDSIIIEKKRRTAHKSIPDLTPPPPVAPRIDLVPSPFSQKSLEEFKKTEGADEYLARMKREREVEEEEERARKDEFFKVMTRIKKGYEATEEGEGAKKRTTEEEDAAPWKIRQKVITNKQEAEQGIFFSPFVPQEEAATISEPGHKPASDVPPTPEVYVGVGDSSGKALWERRRRGKSINTSSPSIVCQVMAERSAAYKAAHLAEEEEQAREAAVQHERAAALVILRAWRKAKSQRAKEEALRKQRSKGNLQTYLQSKLEEQTNEAAERLRASKEAEAKERARQDREAKRQLQEEMERVRNWGLKKLNRPRPSDSSSASTSHNRRSSSLGDVLSNIRRGIEEKKKRAEEILVEQEKASKVDTDEAVSPIEDEREAQRQIGLWIQQCKQAQLEGSEPPFESPNIPCIPIAPILRPAPQNFTPVFAVPTASPSPSTDHGFSIIHTPLSSPTFHEPSVIEPSDSLAGYSTSINGSEIHSLRSFDDYNLEVVDTTTSSAGQEAVDTPSSSAGQDRASSAVDYLLPPASEHSASDGGISNISSGGGRDSTGTLGDMSREQLRDEIRSVFGDALLGIVKQMGSALERNV